MELSACAPELVDQIWPIVQPYLRRSYTKNDQQISAWLLDDIKNKKCVLWVLSQDNKIVGAGTTAIYDMLSGKMLKIEHFGGDGLEEWRHLHSKIEQYAKAEGCVRVLCEGRPGWRAILTDYNVVSIVLEKRL